MMLIQRKKIAVYNLFYQYIMFGFSIITGLVLVPLYLSYIDLATYGLWLTIGYVVGWTTIFDPGLASIVQQKVAYSLGSNGFEKSSIITTGVILSFMLAIVVLFVGVCAGHFLNLIINSKTEAITPQLVKVYYIMLFGTSVFVFGNTLNSINLGLQASTGVYLINFLSLLVGIGFTVLLLINDAGVVSLAVGHLATAVTLCLGNLIYLFANNMNTKILYKIDFKELNTLLKLLFYSFWAKVSSQVLHNLDLVIITNFLGPQTTAIFNITRKIPLFSGRIIDKPVTAISPQISHMHGEHDRDKTSNIIYNLCLLSVWLVGFFVAFFCAYNKLLIGFWVGNNYYIGTYKNILITLGVGLIVFNTCFSQMCFALGSIKQNAITIFIQAIVFVSIGLLGIIKLGIDGLLLSIIISNLVVGCWYYPKRIFAVIILEKDKIYFFIFEIFITIALSAVLIVFVFKLGFNAGAKGIVGMAAMPLVYFMVLYATSKRFRKILNDIPSTIRYIKKN